MERMGESPSSADVTDLYQAAYLVVRGNRLEAVECIPVGGVLSCRMSFSGSDLEAAQDEYFSKAAVVNLYAFRQAYNQINSYIHQAKKSFDRERRLARHEGGAL
jgi:hypothetical protein